MTDDAELAHYRVLNEEPTRSRFAPQSLRAAWWATRAVRRARRDLRDHGLQARVAPPPALPWGSRTGVNAVLARLAPTCLERALVMQSWLASHGVACDVVVGVASDASSVRAHAWVDGISYDAEAASYSEIHRIAPPDGSR